MQTLLLHPVVTIKKTHAATTSFVLAWLLLLTTMIKKTVARHLSHVNKLADLFQTLKVIKGLSIGDIAVSSILLICTFIKGFFFIRGNKRNNQRDKDRDKRKATWASVFAIGFKASDLIFEIAIIVLVGRRGSKDFAEELKSSDCFNEEGDENTISNLEQLFYGFFWVAIVEALGDFFAIILHIAELRMDKDCEKKILCINAGVVDVLEFVLAVINIILINKIIGEVDMLHGTMLNDTDISPKRACICTCCVLRCANLAHSHVMPRLTPC